MTTHEPEHPEVYRAFARETPAWFPEAKLGIFIHWGPYSVPAWAEPIGALGTIDSHQWYAHNPYAEWYFNTIRIEEARRSVTRPRCSVGRRTTTSSTPGAPSGSTPTR
ncbi:alpha-L-fucosidase [Agromyces mangrovi Wang et al. 2018]|uniref:alpha-L-fucosidase n=1 Tax=Agromyces mangrovi TaxID=1858653 RepID=UPI002572F934|nr:alpha-L-fucosidase [Agromyces mangrovi]BDZ65191.1 hypothetical protein GCM10025877_21290 [Agromyces mangrovi]